MKTIKILIVLSVLVFSITANAELFGTQRLNKGDSAYSVERALGQPQSKRVVGYTSEAEGRNKLIIEQWIYEAHNGTKIIITITGDTVTNIERN